jgi:ribosomal protein L29
MADTKNTAKPEGGEPQGNAKVNKMTVAEIDAKLNEVKTAQGGLRSRYAKQLLLRKKSLGA